MSLFEGVANEIIIGIIKETSAGDIVSLASCCKHFSALAQDRLAFHREKRATAPDIVTGYNAETPKMIIHPSKHLQDILEDDDCRFYTRVMKIGSLEIINEDDIGGVEGHRKRANSTLVANVRTQYGHQVTALVADVYTALLPYVDYDVEKWTNMIKEGSPAAVIFLLFTLYPNLKTLEIYEPEGTWSKEKKWGGLLLSLVSIAKRPDINKLRLFSRVSEFVLRGYDEESLEARARLAVPFMELPTMRKIFGHVVDGRGVQWTTGVGTSKVIHLDLTGDVDGASLSSLIRGSKALESFRFQLSPDRQWDWDINGGNELNSLKWGPQADNDAACEDLDRDESKKESSCPERKTEAGRPRWEPRGIVATLLLCASYSLVSLDLTAGNLAGVVKFSNDEPFIDSLRSFRALKLVHLDTMMLFKKIEPSSNVPSSLGKPKQQTLWENMRPNRLVDFLPVTIEDFGMTSGYVGQGLSREDVVEMFTGLPNSRIRLPKLLVIRVKSNQDRQSEEEEDGRQELDVRCRENHIELCQESVTGD